jgi:hypothetical protein
MTPGKEPSHKEKDADALINQLSADDLPSCKRACPWMVFVLWLGTGILFTGLYVFLFGCRHDLIDHLSDPSFSFEIFLTIAVFLTSAYVAGLYASPDAKGRTDLFFVPFSLFMTLLVWLALHMYEDRAQAMEMLKMGHCFKDGLLLSFIPYMLVIIFVARGYTTRPYMAAFLHAGAAIALSWLSMKLVCSMDNSFHNFINHVLPMTVLSLGGGLLARRIFKW